MKPHAITPTDTRDVDAIEIPVHVPKTASGETLASFRQACLHVGREIARHERAETRKPFTQGE